MRARPRHPERRCRHRCRIDAATRKRRRSDVFMYGGVAVFAMLLTLLLIWFVTRAVIRPVRKLTAAARDMSDRRLPQLVESLRTGGDVSLIEPVIVEVESEDEIGELARAFNDVEAVTTQVAQEQSLLLRKGMGDLFVNLARRNQSLLERQLELLDELERNEHDPGAARRAVQARPHGHPDAAQRREPPRAVGRGAAAPVAAADRARRRRARRGCRDRGLPARRAARGRPGACGVGPRGRRPRAPAGRAARERDVVLAARTRPSSSRVHRRSTASSSRSPTRASASPPTDWPRATSCCKHPPVVGLALSRALGLHVVGLLAARHGISVELRPGAPLGTVALVMLPQEILEDAQVPRAARARARDGAGGRCR